MSAPTTAHPTAHTSSISRTDTLTSRLQQLRAERDIARAELTSDGSGDAADRATNVEANLRFALLEQRIQAVETELASAPTRQGSGVAVGDVVTLDLGDGPETFLLGSVEQAGEALDVVTPGSPLGQALLGASVGSTVSYRTSARRTFTATVVAVS
jgi:transcription elongation factor GreA